MIVIGLDLGRAVDWTASVEVHTEGGLFRIRHLDRWRPERENLSDVVHRLADRLEVAPHLAGAALAFDASGIGRAFTPILLGSSVARVLDVYPIVATRGWRPANQRWDRAGVIFAPKQATVAALADILEGPRPRLRCDPGLPLAPQLRRELAHYRETEGPDGLPRWGAPRGEHDDLVSALQLAVWLAGRLESQGRGGFAPANRREAGWPNATSL